MDCGYFKLMKVVPLEEADMVTPAVIGKGVGKVGRCGGSVL